MVGPRGAGKSLSPSPFCLGPQGLDALLLCIVSVYCLWKPHAHFTFRFSVISHKSIPRLVILTPWSTHSSSSSVKQLSFSIPFPKTHFRESDGPALAQGSTPSFIIPGHLEQGSRSARAKRGGMCRQYILRISEISFTTILICLYWIYINYVNEAFLEELIML